MTEQEAYQAYIKAQGQYASELQRFRDSSRPNMVRLLSAGKVEREARKKWMDLKRAAT